MNKNEAFNWLVENCEEEASGFLVEASKLFDLNSHKRNGNEQTMLYTEIGKKINQFFKICWPEHVSNNKDCCHVFDRDEL